MSLPGSLTLGRRCKAKAKPPRRHCPIHTDLDDEQAWAEIVRDADQDPSPWCDMGDIDYRVFDVDQCGHASITDPDIACCSLQDLMLALMPSLQESVAILPATAALYELRAALYTMMAKIQHTLMDGSITQESFEDMRAAVVALNSRCTLVSVR